MSCPATHPTATDVALSLQPKNGVLCPIVGNDGKNVIERFPLRCWHGIGHEGMHGYGAIVWKDSSQPLVDN